MRVEEQFKGWTKPGPVPPGSFSHTSPAEGETLDAISGHYRLFQRSNGHRFSTDDVLTAWYGTTWCPSASRALDLGSGIGSVAMIAAWRLPGSTWVTVEAQGESVSLARKSATYNGLEKRLDIRQGDFRETAMLGDHELFDLITGSPPYFPPGEGVMSEDPQKIACRFEMRGSIADYASIAARHMAPGGFFACVFPHLAASFARARAAASQAGLSLVRRRPVVFREGSEPLLDLLGFMSQKDLPSWFRELTWEEPPLVIRRLDGSVHPEYSAVKISFGFPP